MTVLEAMAAEPPVVVSHAGDPRPSGKGAKRD